jgi:exopolysaccharide production protein ExoQ
VDTHHRTGLTAPPPRALGLGALVASDRVAFWACVAVTLVFSQFWVMPLTGPGPGPVDPVISASLRNYYIPCYGLVVVLMAVWFRPTSMAVLRSPALMLLLGLAFASIAWSVDPSVTFRRCIAAFFTTMAGVVIAGRFSWPRVFEVFAATYAICEALSFVYVVVAPNYGTMTYDFPGAWRGVWSHKNVLGYEMSVAVAAFACAALANPRRRWLWVGALAVGWLLIVLSGSKTSLVAALAGSSCILLVALVRKGPAWAVAASGVWGSGLIALAFVLFAAPDFLLDLVGKDQTLTGRTEIWSAVLHQIAHRPALGFGYGAVWDATDVWAPVQQISLEQGFVIHEAHNSWLGVWLELGYLGLAAWTILFVAVWVRAIAALYTRPAAYFALPFLVVFSLHAYTESSVLEANELVWLIFAAVAAKLALPDQPAARATQDAAGAERP